MPTVHKLGDGYEPHVDEVDGQLVYSLPVDSSFVSDYIAAIDRDHHIRTAFYIEQTLARRTAGRPRWQMHADRSGF